MNQAPASIARRHDLDALRGIAMLLGIVLHGAMSFIPFIGVWAVQDSQSNELFGLLLASIHGFRMPLFFLISGFFTAMLWRKSGLSALLWHRFKRIFLPLVLALVTIIPVTAVVSAFAASHQFGSAPEGGKADSDVIEAILWKDVATLQGLIDEGRSVNGKDATGSTALHAAAFFGKTEAVKLLLEAGVDIDATNGEGRRADEILDAPWLITQSIAKMIGVEVSEAKVEQTREEIAILLADARARLIQGEESGVTDDSLVEAVAAVKETKDAESKVAEPTVEASLDESANEVIANVGEGQNNQDEAATEDVTAMKAPSGLFAFLKHVPLLGHLWFLWFLCWLVVGFAVVARLGSMMRFPGLPKWMTVSIWRYAWLIPMVAVPQFFMREPSFGPATSVTLWPDFTVMLYYAIFFGFGAFYYGADDRAGEVGRGWWLAIPLAVFVAFPVGLATLWQQDFAARVISAIAQASYAWLFTFGAMGAFQRFFAANNPSMRYLSDSSYWLYLAHIPLIIALQAMVRNWRLPSPLKFTFVCVVTSAILLVSYQLFVRYTPLGTLLNGHRKRPAMAATVLPAS